MYWDVSYEDDTYGDVSSLYQSKGVPISWLSGLHMYIRGVSWFLVPHSRGMLALEPCLICRPCCASKLFCWVWNVVSYILEGSRIRKRTSLKNMSLCESITLQPVSFKKYEIQISLTNYRCKIFKFLSTCRMLERQVYLVYRISLNHWLSHVWIQHSWLMN
jgi:hypothetical protein